MRSTVLLPQPEGPSSERNSPGAASSETSSTATTRPKVFLSPRTARDGMAATLTTGPPAAATATRASRRASGRRDGEEPPVAGHALQRVAPAIVESDARARHAAPNRPRRQHLLGPGRGGDARARVDGDAADLRARDLAFPGVEPGPHLEAQRVDGVANGARAAHRAGGPVEDREEPVARRV